MVVDKKKLAEKNTEEVEILNIKLDPKEIEELQNQAGFYPAYHMNKKSWITIILNDTIPDQKIMELIAKSYAYTVPKKHLIQNEWLIPANPKYFDIEKSLKEKKTILWKQSSGIHENDLVYLYVAQPESSIMYQFKVIKIDIPYEYKDKNLQMKKVMKMILLKKYEKGLFSLNKLKEFGIKSVRGPRYMPLTLSEYIKKCQ